MRLVDVHWVFVLDILVNRIGGVVVRKAPTLLQIERPTPVNMDGTDQSLREAIQLIAGYGGASITVSSDVKGTVSYSFHNTPWRAALEYVVRTATGDGGLRYALVEQDFGVLMVVPASQVDKVQGYYRFRYLRPHAPYKGVIAPQTGGSGGGGGAAAAAAAAAVAVAAAAAAAASPARTSSRATSTSRRTTRPRSRRTSRSSRPCAGCCRPRAARCATCPTRTRSSSPASARR